MVLVNSVIGNTDTTIVPSEKAEISNSETFYACKDSLTVHEYEKTKSSYLFSGVAILTNLKPYKKLDRGCNIDLIGSFPLSLLKYSTTASTTPPHFSLENEPSGD